MHNIIKQFRIEGDIESIAPFGSGHINDSYRITNKLAGGKSYLLQRINHHVFPPVHEMMNNIHLVTSHIRQKIEASDSMIDRQDTLTIIPTVDGELCLKDEAGNYWRIFEFLEGLVSYDFVETAEQAYEGAKSYGYFLRFLDDFPAEKIVDVIPDFHNILTRLAAFQEILTHPIAERASECKQEIDYIHSIADQMSEIQILKNQGKLPTRVTHNDTKFNNVLLTADGKGRCVIDLDTVMQGVVHFDFGDGIRTVAGTATEDETDLDLVGLDLEKFRGFAEGYLEVTRDTLSPLEIKYLGLSGALLAYLMGVRFLTDYLAGDVYYKIHRPDHNLIRARNQLKLTQEILAQLPVLNRMLA